MFIEYIIGWTRQPSFRWSHCPRKSLQRVFRDVSERFLMAHTSKHATANSPPKEQVQSAFRKLGRDRERPSQPPGEPLEAELTLGKSQVGTFLPKVCSVPAVSMQFLRTYDRACEARRAATMSRALSTRATPGNTSMTLTAIQKHLKEKIGANLRSSIRMFRVFDYDRQGRIKKHNFRSILEQHGLQLTDKEFQRVWSYYSPNNATHISYKHFLDELGCGEDKIHLRPANLIPMCTKLETSSPGLSSPEKLRQKKRSSMTPSGSGDTTPLLGLSDGEVQALFKREMCLHSAQVWQALQTLDATGTGLVKQDELRAALCKHLFPMSLHTFHKLSSCYGVNPTGQVRWKDFLGHFMSGGDQRDEAVVPGNRSDSQASEESLEPSPDPQDISTRLKEIFHFLDRNGNGRIPRAELRRALEAPHYPKRPGTRRLRFNDVEIKNMLNRLDPEHSGIIHLAHLEKIHPSVESTSGGQMFLQPSPADTNESPALSSGSKHSKQVQRKEGIKSRERRTTPASRSNFNKEFLRNLGAQLEDERRTRASCLTENLKEGADAPPRSAAAAASDRAPRGPSGPVGNARGQNIREMVFTKMKENLEQHGANPSEHLQATIHNQDGALYPLDLRKILQDNGITLEYRQFQQLIDMLGFKHGRMERSVFQDKFEEFCSGNGEEASEAQDDSSLLSAEEYLAVMKSEIQTVHGDIFKAFRLMDSNNDGLVYAHNFRKLYGTLGLALSDREYERLLQLFGLRPGVNLNCAEFHRIVQNGGGPKKQQPTQNVLDQFHEQLACDARKKWTSMSQVLCRLNDDVQSFVYKENLRKLLFTYNLPLRPEEFNRMWSRYDPEDLGCVPATKFLESLGVELNRKLKREAASLDIMERIMQDHSQAVGSTLVRMDRKREGVVKVDDLLCVLRAYNRLLQREQLVHHLLRRNVSMDDGYRKLAYVDYLRGYNHEPQEEAPCTPGPPPASRDLETLHPLGVAQAMERLKELVNASTSSLHKAFSHLDPNGTGAVNTLDFRRVVETICARLSESQYGHLRSKLELNWQHQTVNWKDFLNKFKTPCPSPQVAWESSDGGSEVRAEVRSGASPMQQLQDVVSECKQDITKAMVALDHAHDGTVSKEDFRSVCNCHISQLTSDQFECVWKKMPVDVSGRLRYREFLKCFAAAGEAARREPGSPTDFPECPTPEPSQTGSSAKSKERPETAGGVLQCSKPDPPAVPPGVAEQRVRREVHRCWRVIQARCIEEDRRRGHISARSFLDILQAHGVSVTSEEWEHLSTKYDLITKGHVSFYNFLRHFVLDLDASEGKRPPQRHRLPPSKIMSCEGVPSGECVEAMLRVRPVVRGSWRAIRCSFMNFDPHHTGSISMRDFRKVLRHFGVILSEEEFFHLSVYFDASAAGIISYNAFLGAFLH